MPDRLSYVQAAIEAETARTAAALQAERMRGQGLDGAATAFDIIARVEAVKAAQARENATIMAQRVAAWHGRRLTPWRGEAVSAG